MKKKYFQFLRIICKSLLATLTIHICYAYPCIAIFFIPIVLIWQINIIQKKKYLLFYIFTIIFYIYFSLPFILWCIIKQKCSLIVILYYLISLIILSIITLFFILILKYINSIFKINTYKQIFFICIWISLFYYICYIGGSIYLFGSAFSIYFLLYPLAYFKSFGLPFFSTNYPFLYFFIYQFIIATIHNKLPVYSILLLIIYSFIGNIFFFEYKTYYWEKKCNLCNHIYLHENVYIYPEGMHKIKSYQDILNLVSLATKTKKKLIAGIIWNEKAQKNDYIEGKTGLLVAYPCGYYFIREKNHQLGFAEKKTGSKIINTTIQNILICSEFFLLPIWLQKKEIIVVASIMWTYECINKIYYYIMKSIYTLNQNM